MESEKCKQLSYEDLVTKTRELSLRDDYLPRYTTPNCHYDNTSTPAARFTKCRTRYPAPELKADLKNRIKRFVKLGDMLKYDSLEEYGKWNEYNS